MEVDNFGIEKETSDKRVIRVCSSGKLDRPNPKFHHNYYTDDAKPINW